MSDLPIHTASSKSYMVEDILGFANDETKKNVDDPPIAAAVARATSDKDITEPKDDIDADDDTIIEEKPSFVQNRDHQTITDEEPVIKLKEVEQKPSTYSPPPTPPLIAPAAPVKESASVPEKPPLPKLDIPRLSQSPTPEQEPKQKLKKQTREKRNKEQEIFERESLRQRTDSATDSHDLRRPSGRRRSSPATSNRRRRKRRSRSRSKSRSQSCAACVDLCSFHLAQAKHLYFTGRTSESKTAAHLRPQNQYLYDPRQDLLFDNNASNYDDQGISKINAFRKFLTFYHASRKR